MTRAAPVSIHLPGQRSQLIRYVFLARAQLAQRLCVVAEHVNETLAGSQETARRHESALCVGQAILQRPTPSFHCLCRQSIEHCLHTEPSSGLDKSLARSRGCCSLSLRKVWDEMRRWHLLLVRRRNSSIFNRSERSLKRAKFPGAFPLELGGELQDVEVGSATSEGSLGYSGDFLTAPARLRTRSGDPRRPTRSCCCFRPFPCQAMPNRRSRT